ncbi:MAG: endo alpha-1,4 polygalactosaminidase [Hyphomicrobiaceae bacterium]
MAVERPAQSPQPERRWRRLPLLLLPALAVAVSVGAVAKSGRLGPIKAWHYQLKRLDLALAARSDADIIVMDHSRNGRASGLYRPEEIEGLRARPGKAERRVLAYLSVGEAEEYRFYWNPDWKRERPAWLMGENCRWPDNYLVRFWMDAWKDIIFRGRESYLAQILAAGFDGVYLDRVDAYWDLRKTAPGGRAKMIDLVVELSHMARRLKPGAIVVVQNAEDLLSDRRYRAAIDGIAKEDLLYGVEGTGQRNAASEIDWSLGQLKRLAAEGKPVLVVEYLQDAQTMARARRELEDHGFVAAFADRTLDGRDPLHGATKPDARAAIGTPEFALKHCDKGHD